MDAAELTTPLAIFTAGLVTGIHCAGMCGPISCSVIPGQRSWGALALYHGARTVSYAVIGGLLGEIGQRAAGIFTSRPAQFLPWVLVALFVALMLGLEKKLPVPKGLATWVFRARLTGGTWKPALLLGLATPFLPCGPLYMVFGVAVFAGSFVDGALLMACFAAGTLPVYAVLQSQYFRLQQRIAPGTLVWVRRSIALASVVLLTWRTVAGEGHGLNLPNCPFCL